MDENASPDQAVHVVVRIRPLTTDEILQDCGESIQCLSSQQLLIGTDKEFTFDHVYSSTTAQVY